MSSIKLSPNASGTGEFTIAAPNSNTNRTLNLPDASGTILTNSGTEAGAFSTLAVAGNNISAVNGINFRNRIINGDMVIDQRNNGAAVTATSGGGYFFAADRFITYNLSGVSFTTQRVAEAPAGFTNSNKLTFANAFSLTTTGEATFQQVIEGFNIADLGWGAAGAQSVTVSFWVRASFTGTFSVGVTNSAGTRAYATTYTINAANTWEQKTVTIPGDTSGTWLTDNGAGLFLRFMLASGSNFVVSSNNTWTTRAGAYNAADSIYGTRAIGAATGISAGSTWQITGVQLEAGSVATPFERLPYSTELALCQRYFVDLGQGTNSFRAIGFGSTYSTTQGTYVIQVPVPMRVVPALTQAGTMYLQNLGATSISSFAGPYTMGGTIIEGDFTMVAPIAANAVGILRWNNVAGTKTFAYSAEL